MRVIGTLSVLLLASCASRGVHPLTPQDLATAPYHAVATKVFTGSLMYEGGCLLFRDDDDSQQLLPVWPDGSVFNGTTLTFHRPGKSDQLIVIAQTFLIEGEPVPSPAQPDAPYARIQQQCAAQPFFVSQVRPAN